MKKILYVLLMVLLTSTSGYSQKVQIAPFMYNKVFENMNTPGYYAFAYDNIRELKNWGFMVGLEIPVKKRVSLLVNYLGSYGHLVANKEMAQVILNPSFTSFRTVVFKTSAINHEIGYQARYFLSKEAEKRTSGYVSAGFSYKTATLTFVSEPTREPIMDEPLSKIPPKQVYNAIPLTLRLGLRGDPTNGVFTDFFFGIAFNTGLLPRYQYPALEEQKMIGIRFNQGLVFSWGWALSF